MIKNLKYLGYSTIPSDYNSPDGELALSLNLINEDGDLKPLHHPTVIYNGASGDPVFIHNTSSFHHAIIKQHVSNTDDHSDNEAVKYFWCSMDDFSSMFPIASIANVSSINAIGNTILFLTTSGIEYFLWKPDEQSYLHLGNHLPECPISFGLQGEVVRNDPFEIKFKFNLNEDYDFDEDVIPDVTKQILGKVNKFIAEEGNDKGRFIFPFFVRYAFRLYDGSLTMHSAPILMTCNSDVAPVAFVKDYRVTDDISAFTIRLFALSAQLDYALCSQEDKDMLAQWKDIIRSVDVFISKPIYTYDQNGDVKRIGTGARGYSVCRHTNPAQECGDDPFYHPHLPFNLYNATFNTSLPSDTLTFDIPRRSDEDVKNDILSTANFYLLQSINIDELPTERTIISIKEDYLTSLLTREVMTDDYDSHDTIIPSYSHVYNSRLNLAGINKKLFSGFNPASLFNFTNAPERPVIINHGVYESAGECSCAVFVFMRHEGREIIVKSPFSNIAADAFTSFFFYPNVNAYKAIIQGYGVYDGRQVIIFSRTYTLSPHDFLNGACSFIAWNNIGSDNNRPSTSTPNEQIISLPSKLYTSEVNNPFIFPVTGINTIGAGKILGISSAAKALSQGQFGQFPLYAFTDEGVWAMEVNTSGSFSAKQPISRDVCINADAITQIDSAVLFPTARGIMHISGSSVQCVSNVINSYAPFDVGVNMPHIDKLFAALDSDFSHSPEINPIPWDACFPNTSFLNYISSCRITYDYTHQRIIIFNPAFSFAYIFSLKSNLWSMMHSTLNYPLNAYPHSFAVTQSGELVNFSIDNDTSMPGMLLTRPLKLDAPDILKTIDTIIQRGFFSKGHVRSVLYGSRDLFHWHLVWSSKDHFLRGFRGTPYKYFRIAIGCFLDPGECISGASVQFSQKEINQLR